MHYCSFGIRNGLEHLILITLIINIIVSYDQNISLIFYVKDGSHVRLGHPSCVYTTAQRQYTAVQKMRTPLKQLSLHYYTLGLRRLLKITPAVYGGLPALYSNFFPMSPSGQPWDP